MKAVVSTPCHCGIAQPYDACCGPLHTGEAWAASAEALMRSRYSAYVLGLENYLLATWHRSTRPPRVLPPSAEGEVTTRWLGLRVVAHRMTGEHSAIVEFIARSRQGGGPASRLHERSRFLREDDGRWYYLDGEFPDG